jgi:hypothetical protein
MCGWDWSACRAVVRIMPPLLSRIGADPVIRTFLGGHLWVRLNDNLHAVGLWLSRTSEGPCVFAWSRIWV